MAAAAVSFAGTLPTFDRASVVAPELIGAMLDIAARRAPALEGALAEARAKRNQTATRVSKSLLAKYDRIRTRRGEPALYPLRGPSCGHCDTAIPLQRRNLMAGTGQIEVCEACGVLLYATT